MGSTPSPGEPTRITKHTSGLIDLAYTSLMQNIVASGVRNYAINDPSFVYIVRRSKKPRKVCKFIRYRGYKNYYPENFCSDLHSASWKVVDASLTEDEAWQFLKSTLTNIMDRHSLNATKRVRAKTLSWLAADIRHHMKRRDYHHNKAHLNNGQLTELSATKQVVL